MTLNQQLRDSLHEELMEAIYMTVWESRDTPLEELPLRNTCDAVSNEFAMYLEEQDFTVQAPVYASVDGCKHFVAVITEMSIGSLEEPILVDGTISQFGSSYPAIIIEPITSEFVQDTYDEIRFD